MSIPNKFMGLNARFNLDGKVLSYAMVYICTR